MNKILYSIILLSIAMLVGCNEDLLDIEQKGVKNEQNFYKTDEDAEEAVAAIYMKQLGLYLCTRPMAEMPSCRRASLWWQQPQ